MLFCPIFSFLFFCIIYNFELECVTVIFSMKMLKCGYSNEAYSAVHVIYTLKFFCSIRHINSSICGLISNRCLRSVS
jgi:hypothetical protein